MSRALRVLGFGTYDTDAHPRVGVVLEGLAARGHRVREADRPLGFSTAERVEMLRRPWKVGALVARLASRWGALSADRARFRGEATPDVVVVGYLGHFDVLLARALFGAGRLAGRPAPIVVLDHLIFAAGTALDRGTSEGTRTRALRALDVAALRAADVVLLDTDEHRATARAVLGDRERPVLLTVPVGAPRAWAEAGDAAAATTPPDPSPAAGADEPLSVVFYGLFTPLQGTRTIAEALVELARRGGRARVLLVGGGQDEDQVREILGAGPPVGRDGAEETVVLPGPDGPSRVSVTLRPWVAAERLPAVVAEHDVCLGIAGTTAKAAAVVPNKVYQGAAAGCAVITSDTPPQRRAFGDAAVLVPAGDAGAWADALERLDTDRAALSHHRAACARAARESFGAGALTAELDEVLVSLHEGGRAGESA